MRKIALLAVSLLMSVGCWAQEYKTVEITDAPFEMGAIHEFVYPAKDFNIKKFGLKPMERQ